MLTEYSTYDDIRKFRDKVVAKADEMMKEEKMRRLFSRKVIEWNLQRREHRSPIFKYFEMDGQEVEMIISPHENSFGLVAPFMYMCSLSTLVETKKGRAMYEFQAGKVGIAISSPHYIKRCRERCHIAYGTQIAHGTPYIRNGRKYELLTYGENVVVCRRPEPDIVIYITHLTKDMCTSRNFQGIFAQAGKDIDEHDIYVWK